MIITLGPDTAKLLQVSLYGPHTSAQQFGECMKLSLRACLQPDSLSAVYRPVNRPHHAAFPPINNHAMGRKQRCPSHIFHRIEGHQPPGHKWEAAGLVVDTDSNALSPWQGSVLNTINLGKKRLNVYIFENAEQRFSPARTAAGRASRRHGDIAAPEPARGPHAEYQATDTPRQNPQCDSSGKTKSSMKTNPRI